MTDNKKLADMYKTQQSLTEWLDDIGHAKAETLRKEDNDKRERLKVINRTTGLPFDEPVQFEASDLADQTQVFKTYLHKHGEDLCALRLIPKKDGLPKLRMRGLGVAKAYEWFKEQEIYPEVYRADYVPHGIAQWGTIFVVNEHGFFGEIIAGGHHQLTQGFHDVDTPIVFQYDFEDWTLSREDRGALEHLMKAANHLHIRDPDHRKVLADKLGAKFSNEYLVGYFETSDVEDVGIWFIDYNQTLGEMYSDAQMLKPSKGGLLSGQPGSPGVASGKAQVVHPDDLETVDFVEGSILVCEVTTPDYVPIMRKAAAIVTDQGGILSHAAIVARELEVPCIVGTGDATKVLNTGDQVTVDADKGSVEKA